jgi:signal peptidase I
MEGTPLSSKEHPLNEQDPRPVEAPTEAAPDPEPEPQLASFEEFTFRPTEFRPAVFVSAEPPPTEPADPAASPQAMGVASSEPYPSEQGWSLPLARVGEELVAWFKTLLSAAVYATLIVTFGFQVARVEGQSMIPTLDDQDRLIVNKLAYQLGDPQVGDIVMLYYPEDPTKSFVKRVIGEEGDTLRSVNGRVYRNDVLLNDDFIPEEYRDDDTWGPEIVRRGYYFVMGDHRNNSSDSRAWGQVPKRYIIGKVQLRWWPVNHARIF